MKNLRIFFIVFFIAIAIPSSFLLIKSWKQLETESQLFASERAASVIQLVNKRILEDLETENSRSFLEYRFIISSRKNGEEKVTLSPLSEYPSKSIYSGLLGYFQVEPDSTIHTPLVPEGLLSELDVPNKQDRIGVKIHITNIISQSDLLRKTSRSEDRVDSNQKVLNESNLEQMISDQNIPTPRYEFFTQKKDIVFNVEKKKNKKGNDVASSSPVMEVEVHPFQSISSGEYLIFYRTVKRNGQKYIQGFVVDMPVYFESILKNMAMSQGKENIGFKISYKEILLWRMNIPSSWKKEYDFDLSSPLPFKLSIIFPNEDLPTGGEVILLLGVILLVVSAGGLWGIYKATHIHVESSRKRSDFISAVSHELKTPLTSIRMYSEMLESGMVCSDEHRLKYYNKISSEANRLTRLIQNVLDLSKMERDQWRIVPQSYSVQRLLKDFAEHGKSVLAEKGFSLELQLHPSDTIHKLDKDAMHQILLNVTENAAKFAIDCEPKKVVISTVPQQDHLVLSVRDYGPGVPAGEIDKIFDVFYRIEREMVRKTNGTGIGLSLVKHLCDMMHIKIEVRNMNPGLIMIFYLPYDEL